MNTYKYPPLHIGWRIGFGLASLVFLWSMFSAGADRGMAIWGLFSLGYILFFAVKWGLWRLRKWRTERAVQKALAEIRGASTLSDLERFCYASPDLHDSADDYLLQCVDDRAKEIAPVEMKRRLEALAEALKTAKTFEDISYLEEEMGWDTERFKTLEFERCSAAENMIREALNKYSAERTENFSKSLEGIMDFEALAQCYEEALAEAESLKPEQEVISGEDPDEEVRLDSDLEEPWEYGVYKEYQGGLAQSLSQRLCAMVADDADAYVYAEALPSLSRFGIGLCRQIFEPMLARALKPYRVDAMIASQRPCYYDGRVSIARSRRELEAGAKPCELYILDGEIKWLSVSGDDRGSVSLRKIIKLTDQQDGSLLLLLDAGSQNQIFLAASPEVPVIDFFIRQGQRALFNKS